jgi:uncharacterized membrane protein
MTSNTRRRASATLLVIGGLVYAWFASGVRSFSISAYVVLAVPSMVALLLYGALGGFSLRRVVVTNYYQARSSTMSWRSATPWVIVAGLALALESIGLALGGRSADVPTLSTTVDHLVVNHGGRFALLTLWLAVGASPIRRLLLLRRGAREW